MRPFVLFAALLVIGLLLVAGINLFFGGGIELFRGATDFAKLVKRQIETGHVLMIPPDFNDRPYKREMLRQRANDIKVLVTGSSRTFLIDDRLIEDVLNIDRRLFYNAGMQGSTLEDHVIVWEICKETGLSPKVFFLGLDPWILNENSGESRWEILDAEFRHFKYSATDGSLPLAYYLNDRSFHYHWLRLTDLLGAPRLLVALSFLGSSLTGQTPSLPVDQPPILVKEPERPPERTALHISGANLYPQSELEARFVGESAKPVLARARAGKFYHFDEWYRLSPDRMNLLRQLLIDMQRYEVKVIGFTIPYAPAYYEVLQGHENYVRLLNKQRRFLRDSFLEVGFEYFDMLDPSIPQLAPEDFHDYIHPTKAGMVKVLNYIRDYSILLHP